MQNQGHYRHISPEETQSALESGASVRLIDVRTPGEYESYHIEEAILMPLNELPGRCEAELDPNEDLIVICEHGVRSENAARYLASQGYRSVATMTGGMSCYPGAVITEE